MNPLASKEAGQLCPQGELKLRTAIGGDRRRHPKSSPCTKACATASAVIAVIGMASGHCVNLSIHVSRYLNPSEGGRGPTRSMWTRTPGVANVESGVTVCRWTLDF